MNRRLLEVGQVHRNLRQPAHQESRTLHKAQSAIREAHRLGNLLRNLHIRSVQENVVGDKKLARSDDCSPRRRMHSSLAKIRLARRIGRDISPYTLELSSADVLQILPLRRGRRYFV